MHPLPALLLVVAPFGPVADGPAVSDAQIAAVLRTDATWDAEVAAGLREAGLENPHRLVSFLENPELSYAALRALSGWPADDPGTLRALRAFADEPGRHGGFAYNIWLRLLPDAEALSHVAWLIAEGPDDRLGHAIFYLRGPATAPRWRDLEPDRREALVDAVLTRCEQALAEWRRGPAVRRGDGESVARYFARLRWIGRLDGSPWTEPRFAERTFAVRIAFVLRWADHGPLGLREAFPHQLRSILRSPGASREAAARAVAAHILALPRAKARCWKRMLRENTPRDDALAPLTPYRTAIRNELRANARILLPEDDAS